MKKTFIPSYNKNEIDELFFELYNFYPSKEGQSFELLVGAVLKILDSNPKIIHDESLKGNYDSNSYQIDISLYGYGNNTMIEAKDYSKRDKKVSRPDIDKIVGSIIELDFPEGYFFSSTGYTKDAVRKAGATAQNPLAKKISLYHLRNSKREDDKGRLKKITVNIKLPQIDKVGTKAFLAVDVPSEIAEKIGSATTEVQIDTGVVSFNGFFDDFDGGISGKFSFTKELDENIFEEGLKNKSLIYERVWEIENGVLEIDGSIYPIERVKVVIPLKIISSPITIESNGTPKLLVRSEDGTLNKLITDNQLKGITFEESGEILFNGAKP